MSVIKILTQPEKIEYILSRGCEYFGINRKDLNKKIVGNNGKSSLNRARKLFFPILREATSITDKEIGALLGYSTQNMHYLKRRSTEDLSENFYGDASLRNTYQELREYINIKDGRIIANE